MDKSNILIVEDHALTSFALRTSLENQNFVDKIFEADRAQRAYEIIDNNDIKLVIMDIGLPETDGIEASFEIKSKKPDIKIVILTSHCEKNEVQKCLKAKINAYCSKDIKPDKLIQVLKDVLEGSMYFDSSVAKYVMENNLGEEEITNTDCYNLTKKEKKVLILLASGNNNLQIAKKLDVSVNTIKVHVCSILQKLNVEDRTQAAIKAIRENLIL